MKKPIDEVESAFKIIRQVLLEYKQFLNQYNTQLVIVLFPQRFQVQPSDWELTVKEYRLNETCFDLDQPNNRIIRFCKKNNLECIDPTSNMRMLHEKTGVNYYLPLGDMHWNAQGHEALVESIWGELFPNRLLAIE